MKKENYSLIEILKMRGVGSSRVISLNSKKNDSIKDNRLFVNFMIKPSSLVIIQRDKTFELPKNEISEIKFTERKIKTKVRFGYKIVFDAIIEIKTTHEKNLKFYSTVQSFKTLKKFFLKDWLENLVVYKKNDKEIIDNNIYFLNSIIEIPELF